MSNENDTKPGDTKPGDTKGGGQNYSHGAPHRDCNTKDVISVTEQIAEKFKFKNKKEVYEFRRVIRDYFRLVFNNPFYKQNEEFITLYALTGAAKKGRAAQHIVSEIECLNDAGTTGLVLLEEIIKRYSIDAADRVQEVLVEFKSL